MQKHRPERILRAVSAIIISVFALSAGDAIIKLASASFPIWQIYILRSALVVPVLLLLLWRYDHWPLPGKWFGRWVMLRSGLLVLMWVAYYTALPEVNLSLAAAGYYTAPLLIALLSARLSGDRIGWSVGGAVILGFAGVLVILRPGSADLSPFIILPFVAAFLYALAMVVTRVKCDSESPLVLSLVLNIAFILTGIIATVAGMSLNLSEHLTLSNPFLFGPWAVLGIPEWTVIAVLAVAMLVGSIGAAVAYQTGPAPVVATFDYAYLVFASLWGFALFAETPDSMTMAGMLMIFLAGTIAVTQRNQ